MRDTEVSGEGSRQRRVSEILGDNIKIDVIAKQETADKILTILQKDFFPRFAVVAFTSEVQVVREDKYVEVNRIHDLLCPQTRDASNNFAKV